MKTSELQAMIEKDSEVDENRIAFESLRIPSLHAQYYRLFMEELKELKVLQFAFHGLKKEKTEYYLGKAADEVYAEKPLHMKVLKTDLDLYLNADAELNAVEGRMAAQKMKTEMLEKFISTLKDRSFALRTALEFMKFKAGEY